MHPLAALFVHSLVSTFIIAGCMGFGLAKQDDWKNIDLTDSTLKWEPAPESLGENCLKSKYPLALQANCTDAWYTVTTRNHIYVLAQAPSSRLKVSLSFCGSAVQFFGAALGNDGMGTVELDGAATQVKFPKLPLIYLPSALQKPVYSSGQLKPGVAHTLTVDFRTSPASTVGFDHFAIVPASCSQNGTPTHPSNNSPTSTRPSVGALPSTKTDSPRTSATTHVANDGDEPINGVGVPSDATSQHSFKDSASVTLYPVLPTGSSTPNQSGSDRSKGWQIALLVLGVFAALGAISALVFYWRRRARRPPQAASPSFPTTSQKVPVPLDNVAAPTPSVSTGYVFTHPGSSVSTSRQTAWRNSRIGVSPYTYERAVPYPESATERSSWIDPMPIPTPTRRSITTVPEVVPTRHISFSGKGRILKVQNPETRSTTSVTETDTAH